MAATLPVIPEDVKKTLNLKGLKSTELFELHQGSVCLQVQRVTTSEHYLAATSDAGDGDASRVTAFRMAYAFFMLHSTLEFLNLNTVGEGVVESTGMDTMQTKLLSTQSVEQKKMILERRALILLKPYLNTAGLERLTTITEKPTKHFRATVI